MRKTWAFAAVVLAALGLGLACGSDALTLKHAKLPRIERRPAPPESPLTVATYNAGLAVGVVPRAAERAPRVVQALANERFDLLCVQEFWRDEHWLALQSALAERLPHALRPPARAGAGDASSNRAKPCGMNEIAPTASCALKHCWTEPPARAAECAMRHCRHLVSTLGAACASCLSRDPLRTVGDVLDECIDPTRAGAPPVAGARVAPPLLGGSYGIGLLSSRAFSATDRLELESGHHPRAVLHARIEHGRSPLHVFCTHLTPIMASLPHPSGGSWEDEQSRQVDAMLAWIEQKAGNEPVLVLGDLNHGPAVFPAIRARHPAHYARFERAGFANPYLGGPRRECTFCYDNPLIGRGRGRDGVLIDHVLVRGVPPGTTARRFLDYRVGLEVGGKQETSTLSDHYGLIAVLPPPG